MNGRLYAPTKTHLIFTIKTHKKRLFFIRIKTRLLVMLLVNISLACQIDFLWKDELFIFGDGKIHEAARKGICKCIKISLPARCFIFSQRGKKTCLTISKQYMQRTHTCREMETFLLPKKREINDTGGKKMKRKLYLSVLAGALAVGMLGACATDDGNDNMNDPLNTDNNRGAELNDELNDDLGNDDGNLGDDDGNLGDDLGDDGNLGDGNDERDDQGDDENNLGN